MPARADSHLLPRDTYDLRYHPEQTVDGRTDGQRDRDRILYASAFSRLAEITQVVSPEKGYVFHNRLTHSLKVGQISRRITEKLMRDHPEAVAVAGGLDPDVSEAVGLSHDLGHPPFGHIAEYELDRLVRAAGLRDGYEGNAQTFRIVARLASSDARDADDVPREGLNLTKRTLDGLLKYPWGYENGKKKWGYYDSERSVFEWVRANQIPGRRSATAEIMDWADDITFAIHDLLDFYCAGRIPIDRCKGVRSAERERLLRSMFRRKPDWKPEKGQYEEALTSILEQFPFEPEERFADSAEDRARLYDFATGLIRYFVGALRIGARDGRVQVDVEARRIAEVMKQFIWEYVIENPELAVPQNGQRQAIQTVFSKLLDAAKEGECYLFPASYQGVVEVANSDEDRIRAVSDCISGMTEKELLHFYRCVQGLVA